MTFRRLISVCCLSVMLTATFSCNREEVGEGITEATFSASVPATKSSVTSHETDVNTLDVLVFRASTGKLEASGRISGDKLTLRVVKGLSYVWYAIANAPDEFGTVTDLSVFLSMRSDLDDNTSSSLVMTGRGEGVLDGSPVSVSLSRLVSRIELIKVNPVYYQSAYTDAQVTLTDVFVLRAAGDVNITGNGGTVGAWYNESEAGTYGEPVDEFIRSVREDILTGGAEKEENLYFYTCPNPAEGTKLVLEVSIGGAKEYYPVNIGTMKSNASYRISEVRLLGPGASTPGGDIERASVSFEVSVNAWGAESSDVEL